MNRFEDQLQRAIIELLGAAGVPGLWWFAVPNGGWRSPVEARILKGLGVRAGVHDLIFCLPPDGRMAGLELKGPKGRTSEAQTDAHAALVSAGGLTAIVRTLDGAIEVLTEWGAIKRNRVRLQVVK